MAGEIYNIVKLVPRPEKFNELVEAFKTLSKHVQEQEPKTQIYFALQPPKSQELIIVEKYTDIDNLKAHAASSEFKTFFKAVGPLLAQPAEIKTSSFVGGFDGRSKL
ncbi:putative quinol monooxygenase [Aspergillus candidus]|uniref:ABM domain-containing protein n=1 Tax=Aspergillus candidus TaxID=41067 RepID=A0A2I2F4C9_ASPCN|nr:hypothetical protein BDW47DRAFT_110430 [Aspergillus candidus]PLB35497.1 hypothetical protein BDW47DRAFT_110430 [Aspergillus candidus]